jgi:hypothetical protein
MSSTSAATLARLDHRELAVERTPRAVAITAAVVAAVLGLASAGSSLYWAAGGAALVDTMGGSTERWAREQSTVGVVSLVGWAALKLVVASAAVVATGVFGGRSPSRWMRVGAWIAALQMTIYGGLLTIGGLLGVTGLVDTPASADRHAITWHALLWDPWTSVWGIALGVALCCTRPGRDATADHGGVRPAVVAYDPRR